MTTQRASSSYYAAAAALVIAIASFFVLAGLVIRSPQRLSLFQADAPTKSACPDAKADACYTMQVHNTGNAPGYVQCSVSPAAGTSALFHTSGLPNPDGTGGYQPSNTYSSSRQIEPGQGLILALEVKATEGSKPAQPVAACLSVPAPAGIG
jgi:hypothetical protein